MRRPLAFVAPLPLFLAFGWAVVHALFGLAAVQAKPLPAAPCRMQCSAWLFALDRTVESHCIHIRKNGKPKLRTGCKLGALVRQCRHGKPVCELAAATTSTTSTPATTSTTNLTTSTTTTTTTSTTAGPDCPATGCRHSFDFTNGPPTGTCGAITDGAAKIRDLTCGGLNIGGGGSTVAEGPTPDGSTSRFGLTCAAPSSGVCTILPTDTMPAPQSSDPDCTAPGCHFGTPLPIPNGPNPALSVCVTNTWSAPASGSIDLDTGVSETNVELNSETFITGNVTQPCARCVAGACDRGPNKGGACVSTNSHGLTRDCPSGGVDVGPLPVNLSPLTTGTVMRDAADGNFCPNQGTGPLGTPGCFGTSPQGGGTLCRHIEEHGAPSGPITLGVAAPVTLASVFCIPATGSVVDAGGDLPGPGAVSLPGTVLIQ